MRKAVVTITCDEVNCTSTVHAGTLTEARLAARRAGWTLDRQERTFNHGQWDDRITDYCAPCAAHYE